MMMLRLSRIALVATVAAFFTLVAFGNVTDYGANWQFVTHVMSMDTTFRDPDVMWRAVTDPTLQRLAYGLIIAWQTLTALVERLLAAGPSITASSTSLASRRAAVCASRSPAPRGGCRRCGRCCRRRAARSPFSACGRPIPPRR